MGTKLHEHKPLPDKATPLTTGLRWHLRAVMAAATILFATLLMQQFVDNWSSDPQRRGSYWEWFGYPGYAWGDEIGFGFSGDAKGYLLDNWQQPEPWGRWILGNSASMVVGTDVPDGPVQAQLVIGATLQPNKPGPRRQYPLSVYFNDQLVYETVASPANTNALQTFTVGADHFDANGVRIRFEIGNVSSPKELGNSPNPKKFGVGLKSLTLDLAHQW